MNRNSVQRLCRYAGVMLSVAVFGCQLLPKRSKPRTAQPAPTVSSEQAPEAPKNEAPPTHKAPEVIKPIEVDKEEVAKAKQIAIKAAEHYRDGEYTKAEALLKQAIEKYPFYAPANLLLGKVFLIRGAAQEDEGLLSSARLMFEMALANDPKLNEARLLLELFGAPPL